MSSTRPTLRPPTRSKADVSTSRTRCCGTPPGLHLHSHSRRPRIRAKLWLQGPGGADHNRLPPPLAVSTLPCPHRAAIIRPLQPIAARAATAETRPRSSRAGWPAGSLGGCQALLELLGHVLVQLLLVLENVALPNINPLVLAKPHLLRHLKPATAPSHRPPAAVLPRR